MQLNTEERTKTPNASAALHSEGHHLEITTVAHLVRAFSLDRLRRRTGRTSEMRWQRRLKS
jgi:hypothetical protein